MTSTDQLAVAIRSMITISDQEMEQLLGRCFTKGFSKKEIVSRPDVIPNEIFFITRGLFRVTVTDQDGVEHTTHFAQENEFIADYSSFMRRQPSFQTIQAMEPTETVVMPRAAIEWGYHHLKEGDKLGRLVAEYYFIYLDNRIKNQYTRTPKERYDRITEVFSDIHNRVPQHMIASFLGITPIHLSRLKKEDLRKT